MYHFFFSNYHFVVLLCFQQDSLGAMEGRCQRVTRTADSRGHSQTIVGRPIVVCLCVPGPAWAAPLTDEQQSGGGDGQGAAMKGARPSRKWSCDEPSTQADRPEPPPGITCITRRPRTPIQDKFTYFASSAFSFIVYY